MMGSIAEAVRHMIQAGMSADAIANAVASMEACAAVDEQAERRRAKDRERKRLAKSGIPRNSAASAESEEETPPKRKVSPCTPSKENTPPSSRREASKSFDRSEIVAELGSSLDAEHAEAVADYRLKGRKDKFSVYAARLLAKELAKAPDANLAAEAMIRNGWQGFEVGWMERRQNLRVVAGASPPVRKNTNHDFASFMRGDAPAEETEPQGRTIDGYAAHRH